MISLENQQYIVNGDMSADVVGDWVDTLAFDEIVFHVKWTAVGGTDGGFFLDGSNFDDKSGVLALTTYAESSGSSISNSSVAGRTMIFGGRSDSIPLPRFVRLRYARNAGGGANQLSVGVVGR